MQHLHGPHGPSQNLKLQSSPMKAFWQPTKEKTHTHTHTHIPKQLRHYETLFSFELHTGSQMPRVSTRQMYCSCLLAPISSVIQPTHTHTHTHTLTPLAPPTHNSKPPPATSPSKPSASHHAPTASAPLKSHP